MFFFFVLFLFFGVWVVGLVYFDDCFGVERWVALLFCGFCLLQKFPIKTSNYKFSLLMWDPTLIEERNDIDWSWERVSVRTLGPEESGLWDPTLVGEKNGILYKSVETSLSIDWKLERKNLNKGKAKNDVDSLVQVLSISIAYDLQWFHLLALFYFTTFGYFELDRNYYRTHQV